MKHFIKLQYILIGLIFFACSTFAEGQHRPYPRVPRKVSKNSQSLANWVTQSCKNDSEKVAAIHYWITHHIRYDVKKFLKYDYKLVTTKRILKKRKAICTGYSQLFTEMCQAASIQSVQVPGYTKNHIEHDACDSFYLDDHIWNAVKIDGRWYLIDATWDAGYIRTSHITFISFIRHYLSLRIKTKYVPCYRFVRSPREDYFLKSGSYFQYDHLASNPDWQLTDPMITALEFMNDSAYYHFKRKKNIEGGYSTNASRENFASLSRDDQMIEDGYAATNFNAKNQFGGVMASYLTTNKSMQKLNAAITNKDSAECLIWIDSIEAQAKRTLWYCDSNVVLLKEQQITRCDQVRNKNRILRQQNRQLRSNSVRSMAIKEKLKSQNKSFSQLYKTSLKTANTRINSMMNDKGIYTANPANKRFYADSLLLSFELKSVDSLIEIKLKELQETQLLAKQFETEIQHKIDTHASFCALKIGVQWNACIVRGSYGFDNYEWVIRSLKDTFIYTDSIRAFDYKTNNRHILDSMMAIWRLSRVKSSEILTLYNRKGSVLKRLYTKSYTGAITSYNNTKRIELKHRNLKTTITLG